MVRRKKVRIEDKINRFMTLDRSRCIMHKTGPLKKCDNLV